MNDKLSIKYAIFCPLLISIVFIAVEILGIGYHNSMVSDTQVELSAYVIIQIGLGYIGPTLIASACWSMVQQYLLGIYAGIDDNQRMKLLIYYFIYLIAYVVYLSTNRQMKWYTYLMIGLTVAAVWVLWNALTDDVKTSKLKVSGA